MKNYYAKGKKDSFSLKRSISLDPVTYPGFLDVGFTRNFAPSQAFRSYEQSHMLPSIPYSFDTESIIFHFCFRAEHLFDQPQSSFNMSGHFGYY